MNLRPSRILLVKFLGLWSASNVDNKSSGKDKDEKHTQNEGDFHDHKSLSRTVESKSQMDLSLPIKHSSKKINGVMLEKGIPGLTISISKNGKTLWQAAFGYCDVENQLLCETDAKMRIASISKPLFTATIVGPMIENKKIDLKSSIHKYLTTEEFPRQKYQGREYDITVEQLLSHTSGIKSYDDKNGKPDEKRLMPIGSNGSQKIYQSTDQFERSNYFTRATYRNVIDALNEFKNAPLLKEPGNYSYTSYGFVVLSAVAEKVHQTDTDSKNEQIEDYWMKVLKREWHMQETSLDQDEPILSKRARYYLRSGFNGGLVNAPYVDNSVKWAGGGIISTTGDLVKFGNQLIDCYKGRKDSKLNQNTMKLLWSEIKNAYALGFSLKKLNGGFLEKEAIYHTGAAVGASSVLMIFPESEIVVAVLTNLNDVNLTPLAQYVAEQFNKVDPQS